MPSATPTLSVVIATYNRAAAVERLVHELAWQSLPADAFEVIVVDDGSAEPVAPRLTALRPPYALTVLTQANAGPAAARDRAIRAARGDIVLCLDDDMRIQSNFLAAHLAAHPPGSRNVVLGRLHPDGDTPLALHERLHIALLDRFAARIAAGHPATGSDVYTGNVSFRRADYIAVGGFDPRFRLSEDAELGVRLEQAGASVLLSEAAAAMHASDHADCETWMRRSAAYGAADARVGEKHSQLIAADPWRFLFLVSPVSRPLLLASALAPGVMRRVARLAMRVANSAARLGAERLGLAGATLVYGIQYFTGVRQYAGSLRAALRGLAHHLNRRREEELGPVAKIGKLFADVYADHAALRRTEAKYKGRVIPPSHLPVDLIQRIGFQMMVAYRVMRYFRGAGLGLLAKVASRAIRHLYGADLHWDAELAPGVVLVHGVGLVVSHSARVGPGCILFHHVTLGENVHPDTRETGAPTLEADVHVGPGATLIGPISVGRGTKIMAGVLLTRSVPAQSLVEAPAPVVRPRVSTARGARALAPGGESAPSSSSAAAMTHAEVPRRAVQESIL